MADAAVDEALARVGLGERAEDRYKSYSLGMKQRLAIAATLLKSPDLLILDEPTNGLDPAGIREIRELIRDLGEAGVTVLLSSHILAEVQQVCTSATIIGNGRMLTSGKVEDLLGRTSYRLRVERPRPPQPRCSRRPAWTYASTRARWTSGPTSPASGSLALLAGAGLFLSELTPVRADLETIFLELTADDRMGVATTSEEA